MKNQKSLLGLFLCLSLALQPLHAQQMSGFKKFKQTMAKYAPFQPRDFKAMWTWGNKKFVTKQPLTQTEQQAFNRAKKRTALPAAVLAAIIASVLAYMKFGGRKKEDTSIEDQPDQPDQPVTKLFNENHNKISEKLVNAVKKNDYGAAKKLINQGANVNHREWIYLNQQEDAPLILAIYNDNLDMVKLLVDNNADVNTLTGYFNMNPLLIAAAKNNLEIVKYLLSKGAKRVLDRNGNHPAIVTQDLRIVKAMLDSGWKPTATHTLLLNKLEQAVAEKDDKALLLNLAKLDLLGEYIEFDSDTKAKIENYQRDVPWEKRRLLRIGHSNPGGSILSKLPKDIIEQIDWYLGPKNKKLLQEKSKENIE